MSISDSSKPDVEKMKLEKDVEGLIKALKYDGDWKVRWIVASALEEIGGVRAVDALVRALKDEDVQEKATMALVKKGEAAVELLIQALKDKDWEVRWRATSVLGRIRDERTVESLTQALNDKDGEVQKAAKEALENIKAKKA